MRSTVASTVSSSGRPPTVNDENDSYRGNVMPSSALVVALIDRR